MDKQTERELLWGSIASTVIVLVGAWLGITIPMLFLRAGN